MDEKKIAEMFRDAMPDDTPPASFTHDDVRVASNRQRLRRNRVVAGTALGVVLVVGGVTGGLLLSNETHSSNGVAAADSGTTGNTANAPYDAHVPGQEGREPAPRAAAPDKSFPTQSPEQGGTATGEAGPGAGSTPSGCPKADGELAAALASELPSAAGKQATPTPLKCPDGVRGASFSLRDGNQPPGVVSILLIPKGIALPPTPPWANSPTGTSVKTAYGPKGGEIVLVSQPPEGSTKAPFDDRLADAAKHIAAKY